LFESEWLAKQTRVTLAEALRRWVWGFL